MSSTIIFDIGKTNKKCFLFDEKLQEIYSDHTRFAEIEDDDGFPCDNLEAITNWMKRAFQNILNDPQYDIEAINFSSYGASFVHIDKDGQVISPLYNYLKPYPEELLLAFHQKYGDVAQIATETASPPLGMLNSGLQLYWLKYRKPELFEQIRWSLHLPQYLSYLITGVPLSEYTSVGCHTMLWDYEKTDYHHWVYAEGIDQILPPLVETDISINRKIAGKELKIGVGIHDSSAALLPYKKLSEDPFVLLSTGTWSISLNPFNDESLTKDQLKRDCLNFLGTNGGKVKAARLFLGNEYKIWSRRLAEYFNQPLDKHKSIKPDLNMLKMLDHFPAKIFKWEGLVSVNMDLPETDLGQFASYEVAYHKLMKELVDLQIGAILLSKGNTPINKIFLDGGFSENDLFVHFLKLAFSDLDIVVTEKPLGSAIGATMVL